MHSCKRQAVKYTGEKINSVTQSMDFAIVGHHIVNFNAIALDMSTFFYEIEKLYNPQPVMPTVS